MSTVPPVCPMPPTFPPLPSRRELRSRAFALHCQGYRPRAIGERLGIPRRTICDWIAAQTRTLCTEHEQLDRTMQRRYVIEACYQISAAAWTRYEHLTDRAQRLLALAVGDEPHEDGTPLTAAERRRAQDTADRLRAALPRYLLLAHNAQREVARLQDLYVQPTVDTWPDGSGRISGGSCAWASCATWDGEQSFDTDTDTDLFDPYAPGPAPAPAPAPAAALGADGPDVDDEDDEEDDLPDDPTDMRAFDAVRDRLEEHLYRLRQQRVAAAAANAPNAAAAAGAAPVAAHPAAPLSNPVPAAETGSAQGSDGAEQVSFPSPGHGGGVAHSAGPGEPSAARSLSAHDRPPTPPDALSPHEIGTSGETPVREIENLAETATPSEPPSVDGSAPSQPGEPGGRA